MPSGRAAPLGAVTCYLCPPSPSQLTPAGSKAPLRRQRTLSQCPANFHRLDNWIVAALAWQSTLA